jgi:hypothetical protein
MMNRMIVLGLVLVVAGCATNPVQVLKGSPELQQAYREWLAVDPANLSSDQLQLIREYDQLNQQQRENISLILKDCSWLTLTDPSKRDKIFMMVKTREIINGLAVWSVLMPTT